MAMKHFWTRFVPAVCVMALVVLALIHVGGNVRARNVLIPVGPGTQVCEPDSSDELQTASPCPAP
jgi:hypothetical protein